MGLFTGGTSSPKLEPSGGSREQGESMSGGEAHEGGFGGAPPIFFLKSMSLRMHFKPF